MYPIKVKLSIQQAAVLFLCLLKFSIVTYVVF